MNHNFNWEMDYRPVVRAIEQMILLRKKMCTRKKVS